MRCSDFDKYIHEYVDGALNTELSHAMEEHSQACTHCRQQLNCEKKAITALASVRRDYTPPYVLRDVLDRVGARPNYSVWAGWSAVGATVVLIATVFTLNVLRTHNPTPMISSAVNPGIETKTTKVAEIPKIDIHKKPYVPVHRSLAFKNPVATSNRIDSLPNISRLPYRPVIRPSQQPSARYFVVMTPVLGDASEYAVNTPSNENKLDSSYSIQVEDRDASTMTNLSVTNEVTPDMQPKNTVDLSITTTTPPANDAVPERSFNDEDNRSINCLDAADDIS